jgi:hypothetical protein
LAACGYSGENKASGLEIAISSDKDIYTVGDKINLTIELKNTSKRSFYYYKYGLNLEARDELDRKLHVITNGVRSISIHLLDDFILLRPQQKFVQKRIYKIFSGEINNLLTKDKPKKIKGIFIDKSCEGPYHILLNGYGTYKLRLNYLNTLDEYYDGNFEEKIIPENYKKINAWKGSIESNVLEIQVKSNERQ